MKPFSLILGLSLLFFLALRQAGPAGGFCPFLYCNDERLIKAMDLPRTNEFVSADGEHADLGYKYNQFVLLGIPVWNYDGQWCGFIDHEYYLEIPEPSLKRILQARGISLPRIPRLSAWESWGGKLLVLGMLVFVLRFLKSKLTERRQARSI